MSAEATLALLLASRRDALLLLVALGALLVWGWSRGATGAAGAAAAALLLDLLLTGVLAEGRAARERLGAATALVRGGPVGWPPAIAALGALVTALLGGRAVWIALEERSLALLVGGLLVGWQLLVYLWITPPALETGTGEL